MVPEASRSSYARMACVGQCGSVAASAAADIFSGRGFKKQRKISVRPPDQSWGAGCSRRIGAAGLGKKAANRLCDPQIAGAELAACSLLYKCGHVGL